MASVRKNHVKLKNRKQTVVVDGKQSIISAVVSGIPQAAVF